MNEQIDRKLAQQIVDTVKDVCGQNVNFIDGSGLIYASTDAGRIGSYLSLIHIYAMYKTLVLKGEKKGYVVCCIPVDEELDLKKVAKAAGEKKVEMIHVKDMLAVTGYIRGGCSPVGMKKQYPTYIEETAQLYDQITVSAGQRGVQVTLNPEDLRRYVEAEFVPLI